jgi:hypothetical protein
VNAPVNLANTVQIVLGIVLIDAILVDSGGLRDYEINLDRRFSAEIRVLTGFHAYPDNRFICKTGTVQGKIA